MAPSSPTAAAKLGRAAAKWRQVRSRPAARPTAITGALRRAGRRFWAHTSNQAARLGLQLAGVFFFVFGLSFGAAGIASWRHDHRALHPANWTAMSGTTAWELLLALLFLYFAASSMFRASARR
ncbi:MAG: hypothetical protein ACRD2D_04720 [Terriglobales bacterium]